MIRSRKLYKARCLISSLMGGVVATIYAVVPDWSQTIIKILLAPCICVIFDKYNSDDKPFKEYAKTLMLFILLTFIVGGIAYGISFAFGIDINSYIELGIVAISLVMMLIAVRIVVSKKSSRGKKVVDVEIVDGDSHIKANALCDSGNLLTDSLTGLPIIILSKEIENKLNNKDIEGYVNVSTVASDGEMPIVYLDDVKINSTSFKTYGALSHRSFNGVDVILHSSMF